MDDMSTKPDDSHLFFPEVKSEQPITPEMSDHVSTATDVNSDSSSSSVAIITDASHTLDNPKTRAPPSKGTPAKLADNSRSSVVKPDITLYFLQSSRSIRIAWLLGTC